MIRARAALHRRQRLLVPASSLMLFVAMISSFTPTPLYPLYQEEWSISDALIGVAFIGYPIGVMFTLVLLGGVSDRFGRRMTLLFASAALILALGLLAGAAEFPQLVAGRIVQGVAVALAAGAGAAAMMESHPGGLSRGALVNTLSLAAGAAVGPLLSGFLAEASGRPLVLPYVFVAAAVAVPAALVAMTVDIRPRLPRARLVKTIRLPRQLWRPFSVAAAAILATNLTMGLYGAFGAEIALSVGWASEVGAGVVVSTVLAFLAGIQVLGRNLDPKVALSLGIVSATTGWLVAGFASFGGLPWLLMAGSILVGSGAGLCLLGSATVVGLISPERRMAEIYSVYLLFAFGAMATMALLAGPIIQRTEVGFVLLAACGLCLCVTAYVLIPGRRILAQALPPTATHYS